MAPLAPRVKSSRAAQKALERLSPFELKDNLIALAQRDTRRSSAAALQNAGRGNPNWIAARPREAFFLLGDVRARRRRSARGTRKGSSAACPTQRASRDGSQTFLAARAACARRGIPARRLAYGVAQCGFDADAWSHELADAIVGDHYPEPGRMLAHVERVVHDYLDEGAVQRPAARRAGSTSSPWKAARRRVLRLRFAVRKRPSEARRHASRSSCRRSRRTSRFRSSIATRSTSCAIAARRPRRTAPRGSWRYPHEELARLADPNVKMVFVVNPSNPPSVALGPCRDEADRRHREAPNPGLMLVTDDVYGTFVPNFRSLIAEVPHNTICVYSFSKSFGATGWRLGVIAVHRNQRLRPEDRRRSRPRASRRCASATRTLHWHPEKLRFIDRLVADSRSVALHHTAGLRGRSRR